MIFINCLEGALCHILNTSAESSSPFSVVRFLDVRQNNRHHHCHQLRLHHHRVRCGLVKKPRSPLFRSMTKSAPNRLKRGRAKANRVGTCSAEGWKTSSSPRSGKRGNLWSRNHRNVASVINGGKPVLFGLIPSKEPNFCSPGR